MKVADFDCPTKFLDAFDSKLDKFDEIFLDVLPASMATSFLKSSTRGNPKLLSAWAACETIRQNTSPGTIPTYDQYFEYLMFHTKQLEAAITDNTTSRKANVAQSDYLHAYSPSDEYYDDDAEFSAYMIDRGRDIAIIHDVLRCNKALKEGKTHPPPRTRQEPLWKELQI